MPFFRKHVTCALLLCTPMLALPHPIIAADTEYIAIRKAGSTSIALVLDTFEVTTGTSPALARQATTLVRDGLDFTGLFTLLQPPLNVKTSSLFSSSTINFKALDSIGGAFYAVGTLSSSGGEITLDGQVFEVATGKVLFGKRYRGTESQLRALSHAFSGDVVEFLTGKKSVFGSQIVFISNKSGSKEIYSCDFDGANVHQLTNFRSIALTPALSPDGAYLAFTDFTGGKPALAIRELATGKTTRVAKKGNSIDPAWRNSRELATTFSFEGDQELYLLDSAGAVKQRLTSSSGIDLSPTFSPDGRKMAFVSARSGNPQIFVYDFSSGKSQRLTFSGRYNTQPAWSPIGDKIAFSTWESGGEINIFVINTDGSGLTQLTTQSGENESPSWSPDGRMIVFASNRQGVKKLYVMMADGKNQRPLLAIGGEQTQPSWSLFSR